MTSTYDSWLNAQTEGLTMDVLSSAPCEAFRWIGQAFTSCDRCGRPYWKHTHEERLPRWDDAAPFGREPMELVPITAKQAAAVERKWTPRSTANCDKRQGSDA